jgi:ABC-type uncharacterized transport system fused permease/ATPase subunit
VVLDGRIDNSDQRIGSAIWDFTDQFMGSTFGKFDSNSSGGGIFFILLSSAANFFQMFYYGYQIPLILLGIFLIIMIITMQLLKKVSQLTFQQDTLEGELRYTHSLINQYAESIAFYGGESREWKFSQARFSSVYDNFRQLMKYQVYLGIVGQSLLNITNGSLGYLPAIIHTAMHTNETISVADLMTFNLVIIGGIRGLLALPANLSVFGPIAGNCHRIGQFIEVARDMNDKETEAASTSNNENAKCQSSVGSGGCSNTCDIKNDNDESIHNEIVIGSHNIRDQNNDNSIVFTSVTAYTPARDDAMQDNDDDNIHDDRALAKNMTHVHGGAVANQGRNGNRNGSRVFVSNLSFELKSGESMVIIGPSGCGTFL